MGPAGGPAGGTPGRFGRFVNSPMSSMAIMAGGQMLNAAGSNMGGQRGTALSTVGNTASAFGMARMMGLGAKGTGALMAIPAAYGAAKMTGNFIQDMPGFKKGTFGKDDFAGKAGMTLAGAGAGAATGAAIGAIAGGPVGAAIGATIGTVVGGITGYLNAGKYRKEARNAAKDLMANYTSGIEEAFAGGNVEDLQKLRNEMMKTNEANLKNLTDTATYSKEMQKNQAKLAALDNQIKTYTANTALAERATGTGAEELNRLAEAAGINLRSKMLTLVDVVKLVGTTATQQAGLMKAAWSEISGIAVKSAFDIFDKRTQRRESKKALNASEEALASGLINEESIDKFLKDNLQYGIANFGEFAGFGSSLLAVEESLTKGRLAGLSDEDKKRVLTGAREAFSNESVMGYITGNDVARQGLFDIMRSGTGLSKKSDAELMNLIMSRIAEGGEGSAAFLLQNLQNAGTNTNKIAQLVLGNAAYGEMTNLKNTATDVHSRNIPKPAITTNYNTVNVSGILDGKIVALIAAELDKMNRSNRERGAVSVNTNPRNQ